MFNLESIKTSAAPIRIKGNVVLYVRCPIETTRTNLMSDMGETVMIDSVSYKPLAYETYAIERVAKDSIIGILVKEQP